jgi:hypothetical protein
MAQAALVTEQDLADGARLMQELEQSDIKVDAAFWAYDPILEYSRLIIAVPHQIFESPINAYTAIQRVIEENDLRITLNRVSIMPGDDPKIADLRYSAQSGTRDDVIEATPRKIEIAGRTLEDVHVYRQDALFYERQIFEALKRVAPEDATLYQAVRIGRRELDFLLDDNKLAIVVEVKSLRRPVARREIDAAQDQLIYAANFFRRPTALMFVIKSGIDRTVEKLATSNPRMRIVHWASRDDDSQLAKAIDELLRSATR